MRFLNYIVLVLLLMSTTILPAQINSSVSIKAQATVVEKSEIELITMKDLDIDASTAVDGKIYVSAQKDTKSALMVVKGKSNASFRVTFTPIVEIPNSAGKGSLLIQYEMNGCATDNQGAGEPIDAAERTLKISTEGKYYFWLGGKIDISKARPGKYNGDFTIEVEYI
jgi:hypothetical protein